MLLNGSCQCGRKQFSVEMDHNEAYYCHCRMCQKAFGNIFATLTMVKKAQVKWLKEEPDYFNSSVLAKRGFCSSCGTPLTFEFHHKDNMDLAVGCFDDPNYFNLVSHSGIESRVHWMKDDGLPGYVTENNQDYVRRWKEAYGQDSMPRPLKHENN
jgi:hypothetical protein